MTVKEEDDGRGEEPTLLKEGGDEHTPLEGGGEPPQKEGGGKVIPQEEGRYLICQQLLFINPSLLPTLVRQWIVHHHARLPMGPTPITTRLVSSPEPHCPSIGVSL